MGVINPFALATIDKIVASNKKENEAVKKAKTYQNYVNQPYVVGYSASDRTADAKGANINWKDARTAANKTKGLIEKLWTYQHGDGYLSTTYPISKIQTLDAIVKQEQLGGGTAEQRAHNYSVAIAANNQRIENLKQGLKFDFPASQGAEGTTDINGNINVDVPVTNIPAPGIDPGAPGVPVPGAAEVAGGATDPLTGSPVQEESSGLTFNQMALGGAAVAAALLYYVTRK